MKSLITLCGSDCPKCPRYTAKSNVELEILRAAFFNKDSNFRR